MNRHAVSFFLAVILQVLTLAARDVRAAVPPPPPPTSTSPQRRSSAAFYPQGRDRPHDHRVVNDEVVYAGWRRVIRRSVASPVRRRPRANNPHDADVVDGGRGGRGERVIHFDVVDQAHATGGAVIVFAWNSTSKTATIVREYMPGPHRVMSGLAAGIAEDGKHAAAGGAGEADPLVAARCELEEECHLAGGTWHRLTEEGVSVPMDKYVVTEITPYLVVDPRHVPDPRPLDHEEDIEIVTGVSVEEIIRMIREGDFNLVGGWGALLAVEKLRELGEI